MKLFKSSIFILLSSTICLSQEISLEDIWLNYKFYASSGSSYSWTTDSSYTTVEENKILASNIASESSKEIFDLSVIPDSLSFSSYEISDNYLLVFLNKEALYRRSFKSYLRIYDLQSKKVIAWTKSKVYNPSLSPNHKELAYTYDNNLYSLNLKNNKEVQLTFDGSINKIINGRTDWVYEEEFGFTKAYVWVEDAVGTHLAFLKFDETKVKTYDLQVWGSALYPELYQYKYPKVGEENSTVSLWVISAKENSKAIKLDATDNQWEYFSKLQANDKKINEKQAAFSYAKMNRKQNELELNTYNSALGTTRKIYQERAKTYVELPDGPFEYDDGFIIDSYKNGHRHFYLQKNVKNGKVKEIDLTPGKFDVKELLFYDHIKKQLYFTALFKNAYTQSLCVSKNGKVKQLIKTDDWTSVSVSPDGSFAIVTLSNLKKAPVTYLYDLKKAKRLRILHDNKEKQTFIETLNLGESEFFTVNNENNTKINCLRILPSDFDENKKYPVLMHCYGGPGHQVVTNRWSHFDYYYHQLLAQKGYIIILADGRGTDGRGKKFRHASYGQMGKVEHLDQVAVANYVRELDYVDSNRVGIWGWSFGGYLSSLCLMKSPDVFSTAIAVAPVTNWKYYDNIYTERYMGLIEENLKGYNENSPVNYAKNLKGNYLLIHGTADDNVHFQNAIAMQQELLKHNKQFEVFYYPDKDHGIYGGTTRYNLYNKMMNFILEKL